MTGRDGAMTGQAMTGDDGHILTGSVRLASRSLLTDTFYPVTVGPLSVRGRKIQLVGGQLLTTRLGTRSMYI